MGTSNPKLGVFHNNDQRVFRKNAMVILSWAIKTKFEIILKFTSKDE